MCTKAEHKSDEEQASNISGLSNAVQGAMQAMLNGPVASLPQPTSAAISKVQKCALCIQAGYG